MIYVFILRASYGRGPTNYRMLKNWLCASNFITFYYAVGALRRKIKTNHWERILLFSILKELGKLPLINENRKQNIGG